MWRRHLSLLFVLLFVSLFLLAATNGGSLTNRATANASPEGQVVIAAPVQIIMYAGDRFLAANLEAIRSATITLYRKERVTYRLRAHRTVALLNPCHEDNYYLGNAILTWGGMENQGNELLKRAIECRFWDEIPPFFYGFNQYFFHRNIDEARKALELAATRATDNAAALRKLAIMITVEQMEDDQMALNYLRDQMESAKDTRLQQMLQKRVQRLEGLITLRHAQHRYEKQTGRQLTEPGQLISSGILNEIPEDPMRLGYEFIDGKFRLKQLKIQGMENQR